MVENEYIQLMNYVEKYTVSSNAIVLQRASGGMADALASGVSVRKDVRVQLPSCPLTFRVSTSHPMFSSHPEGFSLKDPRAAGQLASFTISCWIAFLFLILYVSLVLLSVLSRH